MVYMYVLYSRVEETNIMHVNPILVTLVAQFIWWISACRALTKRQIHTGGLGLA